MRITAFHDHAGNIVALAGRSLNSPPVHIGLPNGARVTELDVPDVTSECDTPEIYERFADLTRKHRVDVDSRTLRSHDSISEGETV